MDDVKLQLGIDVEALQKSASQATSILSQAFEKNLSANLLGNGLAPTQGPAQNTEKDTVRSVVDALGRVNQTLIAGFTSLAGGAYLGGAGAMGGGAGFGGAGAGGGGGMPPMTQPGRVPGGGGGGSAGGIGSALSRAGDLAAALMPSAMRMFMGGFYGTDVMGFAHNLVSQIPIAGKLLGAVTGPFHQVMQQNDEFKNMQYELFRDAGESAMQNFTNLYVDDDYREQFVKKYGFSRGETAALAGAVSRSGVDRSPGALESVLNLQGTLGLGQEAAGTMGALQRAGVKGGDETSVLASAIGVAVSTNLAQGRWGEMLDMWQRAAQSSIDTDISVTDVMRQQQFIGSLGQRYQGQTPASESMKQSLMATTSNMGDALSLRNAMTLSGGDYFKATALMAASAQTPNVQLEEMAINDVIGIPAVKAYLASPSEDGLEAAAGMANLFHSDISQLKFMTLLRARKRTKGALFTGVPSQAQAIGQQIVSGAAPLPETALGPRRSQAEAQRPSDLTAIQGDQPLVNGGWTAHFRRALEQRMRGMEAGDVGAMPTMQELQSGQFQFQLAPGLTPQNAPVPTSTGPVTRLNDLSPDEIQSAAAIAGIGAETMRSWFQMESGGRLGEVDTTGAYGPVRGFAQMNREEAASIGVTGGDFDRLSTDKAYSLQKSAELARKYLAKAREQAPAGWSQTDVAHLMKLDHAAGTGGAQAMLQRFQRNMGRAPANWDELFQEERPQLSGGPGRGQLGALLNANNLKVEVVVTVDQTGRVSGTKVKNAAPGNVGSPGQLVGGGR